MVRGSRILPVFLLAGALVSLAGAAQAQNVYAPFYGWAAGTGPYNLWDQDRVVPHYMLYPPVYYSLPVPRTYGWSPFAYPPGVMTPEVAAPQTQPLDVPNPHVPQKSSFVPPVDRGARAPLVIQNPYYAGSQPQSSEQLSRADGR